MLPVVGEVAIGQMLRVIDGFPEGGRQVGLDARSSRLDVVVMLSLVLKVEVVLGPLHRH